MFKSNRIFSISIKIDPIPDTEESIYYTLHSQKFYEVTDLTNILTKTSPEIDDTLNPDNENPYTVRRERPERRELLRARRRSSLSFPTQNSTLVSYGSTDIESNIIRPLETGHSEPPSRTETPTLHNFSLSSPSEHSSVNTDHTPTPSELRANPFLPPTFSQRQDFIFSRTLSSTTITFT